MPATDQPRGGGGSGVSNALAIARAGADAPCASARAWGAASDAAFIVEGAMQPTHSVLPMAGTCSRSGAGGVSWFIGPAIDIAISGASWHAGTAAAGAGRVPSTNASRMRIRTITRAP